MPSNPRECQLTYLQSWQPARAARSEVVMAEDTTKAATKVEKPRAETKPTGVNDTQRRVLSMLNLREILTKLGRG